MGRSKEPLDATLANLARLGLLALNASNDGNDFDGGDIHDEAVRLGLYEETRRTEPCGPECLCAEGFTFPVTCTAETEALVALRDELEG